LGIKVQQAVDFCVHEAAHHLRRQPQSSGDSQQVGEHRAVVPAEMAVGAGLIFPSIPPVNAGTGYDNRRVNNGVIARSSFDEDASIISGAKPA